MLSRRLAVALLAVALSAVVLNLALSWAAENLFPEAENMADPLGELVSMLRMHYQAPLSTSLLMGVVAALSCVVGAPIVAPMLKDAM